MCGHTATDRALSFCAFVFRDVARGMATKDDMSAVITDGGNSAAASAAPASFAEALATDASPASETPEQSQDATAAAQPATEQGESSQQGDERSPFIPRPRFDEVNGQLKELKAWKEQRSWAEQVDQQTFQQMATWYEKANANPLEFATSLIQELQQHPTHSQALRSMVARALAQRNQPAGPDLDGIAIDLGNGQSVSLSDLKAQWLQDVRKEFQPMAQTVESVRAEREQTQLQAQATQFATGFMGQLTKLPGFTEHKAKIAEAIKAKTFGSDHPAEVRAAALEAYYEVVLPTLTQKAQSQLLDTLQHKAGASTSVNPGSAAPATSKSFKSFTDLPADMWK